MQMPDLIGLGEALVEFTELDPLNNIEGKYLKGFGGDTSNTIIAAARQGASVGFISAVGKDRFGQSLLSLWQQEGVDTQTVDQVEGQFTGIYFVFPSPAGREFAYYRKDSAASLYRSDSLPLQVIANAKVLHISSISQSISVNANETVRKAINTASAANVIVSYDTNLRLNLWSLDEARATINQTLQYVDIIFPSIDDSQILTGLEDGEAIVDHYLNTGPNVVALKIGAQGCLVATKAERIFIPSITVKAVDATGAGDAFNGAFLANYLKSNCPFQAAKRAVIAGALTTTGLGAVRPIPYFEQIEGQIGN